MIQKKDYQNIQKKKKIRRKITKKIKKKIRKKIKIKNKLENPNINLSFLIKMSKKKDQIQEVI